MLRLYDATTGILVGDQVHIADTFWTRAKGLLGRKGLHDGEGLILVPCNGIHSFGMRFPFDAIFLNHDRIVMCVVPNLLPFRVFWVPGSTYVIELPAGKIWQCKIQLNHRMDWCE